ncbi:MAG: methylated-DNA--[protein]-cysteine S-methyltransferase [Actinomycetota bacterium]|nr:methylated-DNA--[protein]-cysteine S-methyltransferase [Actinomycetota bacterium]
MPTVLIDSPVGPLELTSADDALSGLRFVGRWPGEAQADDVTGSADTEAVNTSSADVVDEVLAAAAGQLAEYFAGDRTKFDLPLAAQGDEFHRNVWRLIAEIPYGETVSYGSIAERLGGIRLSQAVGGATGRNPLAIVVPCHRVVGAHGSLTGFGGGLDRKRFLLALEESADVAAARLF